MQRVKGIAAKAKAGGDLTGTSSIDQTIEHDAAIQPGNSGRPLLTFESLGVNGFAISDGASGITGIWVASIGAGTPTSQVGLVPGDIITSMNGLPVGTDGTFKDYCDAIRTAGTKPIAVAYADYVTVTVTDDTGTFTFEIPAEWSDIATSPIDNEGVSYARVEASTDLAGFNAGYSIPGVKFLAVPASGANPTTCSTDSE